MAERRPSLPGVHPIYSDIALNPEMRQIGIRSASQTIAEEFGGDVALSFYSSLNHFSRDLDTSLTSCKVNKDRNACESALVFAGVIAKEMQEVDQLRLSKGAFPTIVFEASNNTKNGDTIETS